MKKQNLLGQNQNSQSFFAFIRSEADRHKMAENCRTAETYLSALSNFKKSIIKHPRRPIRRQYRNALSYHNNKLKTIAMLAGLDVNLTMYVARHSWASTAYFKNIPVSVISAGMGHSSEHTTEIYLSSICNKEVDAANSLILGILG